MTRRLVLVLAGLLAAGGPTAAKPTRRPNVLLILADDLGYGDLGCYGSPVIKTPHLDRFATEGVRLTAFYAGAPNCSPSRAALLTGRTSSRVGLYDILAKGSEMRLREEEVTVAERLRGAGYDTFHAGKWHLTPGNQTEAIRRHGFDQTAGSQGRPSSQVEAMARWLEGRTDPSRPFFSYLALHVPHEPVNERVDPPFRARYEGPDAEAAARKIPYGGVARPKKAAWENRTAYFGCVSQMDEAVGRLLKLLDDRKLRDDTFILFASDNGPEHRAAYSFGSPGPLRGAKGHVYEGGIRVPGIVRWPGHVRPGTTSDVPIGLVDVLPTLCALAGAEVPTDRVLDGVNFLPALAGEAPARPRPLYWSMWAGRGGPQYALRDGDWKVLAFTEPLPEGRRIIDHIKTGEITKFELYNVRNDRAEAEERSGRDPEVFERMKQTFLTHHRDVLAEGPTWDLEAHRGKARQAWPGRAGPPPEAGRPKPR